MEVTSTPTPFSMKILIVPTNYTDEGWRGSLKEIGEAAIVFTADGRCLKNRFGMSDTTVLEVRDY